MCRDSNQNQGFGRTRPTFADIAKASGFSKATVSLALRNNRRISVETRKRVQQIALNIGYRPNPLVSANMELIRRSRVSSCRAPTIALLSTWVDEKLKNRRVEWHVQSRFLSGAKQQAEKLGFNFDFLEFDLSNYSANRIQQVLFHRNISGLVIAPLRCTNSPLELDWSKFAIASIGFTNPHAGGFFPCVYYDSFRCMQDVLQFLNERGYRRIGFITDSENEIRGAHQWNAGFLEYQNRVMQDCDIVPMLRIQKPECRFTLEDFGIVRHWFLAHKPEAIISFRTNVLKYLKKLGYDAPRDFGYMVLNSSKKSDGCSGYRQPHEEMGEIAVNIVANRLYTSDLGVLKRSRRILLTGEFVEGNTIK